ncbi:MAG: M48 family metalloprotease [Acidobacteriia bacterium]|nr:M48 family metalloprotease [Terriglobia bacterium]
MRIRPERRHRVYLLGFLLFASSTVAQIKRYHPDIQNIGKRDLTPNIWGVFPVSSERENALGAELSKQFETTVKLLNDTLVADYVTRLGGKLVQHSDAKSAVEFKIIDSEQADFTVLPAGHIFVNTGLIVGASHEAELAAVLSNAIAHVAARHVMRELSEAQILQLPAIPGVATAWHWSRLERQRNLELPGINLELEGIKSTHEKEADQLAIQYLWNTGYDPAAYITVLEKLAPQKLPPLQLKIQDRLRSAMVGQQSLPDKLPYLMNSPEFDAVKSHLLKRQ